MTRAGLVPRTWRTRIPIRAWPMLFALAGALAGGAGAQETSPFRYWNPEDTATVPKTLSAMKIYRDAPGKGAELIPQAHRFEVNAPAWNDGAKVRRWVVLKPGTSIGYRENDDYWSYPESTVFIQELSIDTNGLDTNSRVLWETRVLVNKKETIGQKGALSDRWFGYSYRWRRNQLDADRINLTFGLNDSIRVWPQGVGAGKAYAMKKWHFPSIYDCERCHQATPARSDSLHGRSVLGFFTAQLNRPHSDAKPALNQLEYFFRENVLSGARSDWDAAPHWRGLEDSDFTAYDWLSLDIRARSYIAANCSGCHGYRGNQNGAAMGVDDDFDFHTMTPRMEIRNHSVSWPFGLDTVPPFYYPKDDPNNPRSLPSLPIVPALAVPGHPEKSVLLFRVKSRNTEPGNYDFGRNQMPALDTYAADSLAVGLLTRWIKDMRPDRALEMGPGRRAGGPSIRLQGRLLRVDPPGAGREANVDLAAPVDLVSFDGRKTALRPLGRGVYEVPAGLPKGIYRARIGSRSVLLSLF